MCSGLNKLAAALSPEERSHGLIGGGHSDITVHDDEYLQHTHFNILPTDHVVLDQTSLVSRFNPGMQQQDGVTLGVCVVLVTGTTLPPGGVFHELNLRSRGGGRQRSVECKPPALMERSGHHREQSPSVSAAVSSETSTFLYPARI
ncbi:hypothetical protein F2P81_006931 [Scophthalmus maximus]|uniref:Uncharacterized protein n=1 Tax=Scophthalmus maximus TaxID=52904 RepID=A0A6A4T4S8_SCOMX|nr:hypothetical protein F2P81_006931 [Scophthalmus maximus]